MSRLKLILLSTLLFSILSCKKEQNKKEMPPLKVEVCEATIDSLYSQIKVASQIKGLNSAVIQPRINGFLIATHYEEGMPVKRGDLLFTIDPSTFSTTLYAAQAALESAIASEVLAQRNYERAEPLAKIDAISQSDLDQYRATYKAAKASTKSAQETLRSAELEIGYTKIYAPIDGIAAKTTASIGDYIGPGTLQSELTTITQVNDVYVEVAIPTSQYLSYITNSVDGSYDNSALLSDIRLKLSDSTTYQHQGEYYYTLMDTPASSSTIVIAVKFPNPTLLLKEGMFARVTANIGERQNHVVIPRTAVSQLQGVNSVWIIKADSTAEWRTVDLGKRFGSMWSITSGLKDGERVVVSGGLKLHNGIKVAATVAK